MQSKRFSKSRFGKSQAGKIVKSFSGHDAFVPSPLPGKFAWNDSLVASLERASAALGKLQGLGSKFPNPKRLVRMFLRKEAEASSRIEQTFARVRTMLLFEHSTDVATTSPSVKEVENNFQVLERAFQIVRERSLSLSDVRGLHQILFTDVQSPPNTVGQFRQIQNWIGNSRKIEEAKYVPPPPLLVTDLMQQLVEYLRKRDAVRPLIRAAMVHYQFEAIHPFEDGNGRIGRAIVLAQLHSEKVIDEPLLNPSAGLERNRREYYNCLLDVSRVGAWTPWIELFCRSIADEAEESVRKLNRLELLRDQYHRRIRERKRGARFLQLIDHLMGNPMMNAKQAAQLFDVTPAAGQYMLEKLESLKIVQEITGQARSRIWLATEFLDVFAPGEGKMQPGHQ